MSREKRTSPIQGNIRELPKEAPGADVSVPHVGYDKKSRRELVFQLATQGVTQTRLAKLLGVSPKTIWSDLRALRKQGAERTRGFDAHAETGDHLMNFEYLYQQAMKMYHKVAESRSREKRGWMDQAMKARAAMVSLQMDTGLIPSAGAGDGGNVFQMKGPDGRKYDIRKAKPADLRMLAADLMGKIQSNPKLLEQLQKRGPPPQSADTEEEDAA